MNEKKEFLIMIVDDNEQNRLVLQREVQKGLPLVYPGLSFKTLSAENGQLALDLLLLHEFDLVLMDVDMPVMDGLTATEKIKADPNFKAIPVLAITAQAMKGDEEKCRAAGCDEYISKPIDRKRLKELIGKRLGLV
ncbi:MAG: response regulator [Candidatus Wallbacteria bacterium]|nr:response regulator [Candidatus Wallbacteria bacterium]